MPLAKTTRPSATTLVARPRLFRGLDRAAKRLITWVSAPPGAGKTVLIASYLVARHITNLWYQIDNGDNDIASFFYFLSLAAPRRRQTLPLLTPEYRQGLSTFTRRFFREFYGRLKAPFALVFDNYQEVPVASPLHEVMREALAELPKGARAIFISRSEPPPAFARLRAQRAMEIVDWPQLKFTPMETTGLIRKLTPGRWSKNAIANLQTATDGWAAGLVLSLEQLRSRGETPEKPTEESSEVLFDFAGEIFKKADPVTQEVLLQTSFVPRVTAAIAAKLTGHVDAGEILARLHKQNYFTNKLAGGEPTYEYHPLFRKFLLALAHRTYSSDRLNEIRRGGARVLENAGQPEVSANLLRDADEHEDLARLICRHAPALLRQGRNQTVQEWLAIIPEAVFDKDPWLLYWRGLCGLGYRYADCRRDCERALAAFRERGNPRGTFLSWALLISSCVYGGDTRAMDPWIELLDTITQEIPEFPSEEIETHVAAAMFTAIAMRRPDHPDGAMWAERALVLTRNQPDQFLKVHTFLNWLVYYLELGNIAKTEFAVEELSTITNDKDTPPIVSMNAAFGIGWYEALSAMPSYKVTVARTLELADQAGFEPIKYAMLMVGLIGALSDGDLALARPWLKMIVLNRDKAPPLYSFIAHWMDVWGALIMDDLPRAIRGQPEMLQAGLRDGWPINNIVACLLSAHVLLRHDREEAWRNLDRAHDIARAMRSSLFEFKARLTEAHLHFEDGRESEGLKALSRAMTLGKTGSFVNTFVWQPKVMAKLCAKALEAGIEVEYVQGLVRKRRLVPQEAPVEVEAWPWPLKIYSLGRFGIFKDDRSLEFKGKVQRKPLELLKAMIPFGGRGVREESLIDALWPDAEGDAGHFALTSAIHRLRRLLGRDEVIIRQGNELSVDDRYCWVDVWAMERWLERADSAARGASDERTWAEVIRLVQRAVELYKGHFLAGDTDAPWAVSLHDRLRRRLLRQLVRIGDYWEHAEDLQQAADIYEEGLRVDACAEDVCRRLMRVYHNLGRPAEIRASYHRCRQALTTHLGILPSAETEALLKRLSAS